jgi:hypothetical protein
MNQCDYCYKDFSTKGNLVKHQSSKSCSIIVPRQKLALLEEEMDELKEEKVLIEEENRKLKADMTNLEIRLKSLENEEHKINIINNNTFHYNTIIQNLTVLDLSEGHIQEVAKKHFSRNYMEKEHEGIALFTFNHLIRNNNGELKYICVDQSRRNGLYRNDDGIVRDTDMERLTFCVYHSLKPSMNDITYKKYIEDQSRKCKLGDQESKKEDEELIVNSRYAKHMENINSKNKSKFKNTIATYCYMKNIQEDNLRSIIADGN